MMVEVEMNNYSTGKRKLKIVPRNFEISTELWNNLCDFAETDIYCNRGTYDWNYNTLYLCKNSNLQELLEKHCISVEELQLLKDFQKELWGSLILLIHSFFSFFLLVYHFQIWKCFFNIFLFFYCFSISFDFSTNGECFIIRFCTFLLLLQCYQFFYSYFLGNFCRFCSSQLQRTVLHCPMEN